MLRVVDSFDDAVALIDWVEGQPYVALDTETTGFDIYSPGFAVRLVQFGTTSEAWVVPLAPWVGIVQEAINRASWLVLHNAKFDSEALAQHGITVPWTKVDDTMIAMRLAEPHRPAALKDVATRLISRSAASSQQALHKAMKKNKWDWVTIPIDYPDYCFYAAMDTVLTARVYEHPVTQRGLHSPVYPLEMDVRQVCTAMERNGIRIDVDLCEVEALAFSEEITSVKRYYDSVGINLTSNAELARHLLSNGVKITKTTDGGAPSVDKDSLLEARLTAGHAEQIVIDDALRVRKLQKLLSSYLLNFIENHNDGLLHPSIETVAARTGRMSIRNPAMQTLPRNEDIDAARIRNVIIPRNDDEVLVACDFAQIEYRLIACLSEDKDLQEAFLKSDADGTDFFTEATRVVYGDTSIDKTDTRRTLLKNTMYANAFGAGIVKMAATAKVSVDDMRAVADAVFRRYPGIKAFGKICEQEARDNDDYITTPYGRKIWVDPDFGYKAMNAKIQATAGDVFKRAMVDMAHAGLEEWCVLPVHDEVLFSIPKDLVDDARHVIQEVMSDRSWPVPLLAEPSHGALSWSSISK